MAKLDTTITFTGRLGDVTAFKRKGSDKIILRKNTGINGERVKKDPAFLNTRRNNAEFSGCAKAARDLKSALFPLARLSDFNISSRFIRICKAIQKADTTSEWGKRSILLSREGKLLEGFSLNDKQPFNEVMTGAVSYQVSRNMLNATLDLPELVPGINLRLKSTYAYYRIIFALGVVPDLVYNDINGYVTANPSNLLDRKILHTEWYNSKKLIDSQVIGINLDRSTALDVSESLLLSIGIEPGAPGMTGEIEPILFAGCAKVLALG